MTGAYDRARTLLADNLDVLEAFAKRLLEKETMNADEIDELLQEMKAPNQGEPQPKDAPEEASKDAPEDAPEEEIINDEESA